MIPKNKTDKTATQIPVAKAMILCMRPIDLEELNDLNSGTFPSLQF